MSSVSVEFTINTFKHRATVGLYLSNVKELYNQLKLDESTIMQEVGEPIEWSEGEKDGRMLLTKKLNADFNQKKYTDYFDWFMQKAILLKEIAKRYNIN